MLLGTSIARGLTAHLVHLPWQYTELRCEMFRRHHEPNWTRCLSNEVPAAPLVSQQNTTWHNATHPQGVRPARSETSTMQQETRSLQASHMCCQCQILRVRWSDFIKNKPVSERRDWMDGIRTTLCGCLFCLSSPSISLS